MTQEEMLYALIERQRNPVKQINNSRLYAGSPMYYYCQLCGWQSDKLPESHAGLPKKHCDDCEALRATAPGASDATLKDMANRLPPVPVPT